MSTTAEAATEATTATPLPSQQPLMRSAVLGGYAELASSLGLDPAAQLRAARIAQHNLADPDFKIPVAAVARLLENSARQAGVEDFGLRMSESIHVARLGLLALLVQEVATVGQAMTIATRHMYLHNEALHAWTEPADDHVMIRLEYLLEDRVPARQITAMSMGVTYRGMRTVMGGPWTALAVHLRHDVETKATYRTAFGTRVEFGKEIDGIVCRKPDFAAPNQIRGPVAEGYIRRYLEAGLPPSLNPVREQVRRLIWGLLPAGNCSAERVAHYLGIDRRTLHRQLTRNGGGFTELLDELRRELATRHIACGNRSLTEIGELLGFSSVSDFSHWFARQFGCSASVWRKQLGQATVRE